MKPPENKVKKILAPLPDRDFDTTEISVPWKILKHEGWDVIFATENGSTPETDPYLIRKEGVLFGYLGADPEAKLFYKEMRKDPHFQRPISWGMIKPTDYDAVILTGGHAKGMRQFLEGKLLQHKLLEFWKLGRPVGAVCHGTVVLARTIDPETGFSVLHERRTTGLPKYLENLAHYLTSWKMGDYYRTYPATTVEEEVTSVLAHPSQFAAGSMTLGAKGSLFSNKDAFVVVDGNYVSARWPGDAYLYGRMLVEKIYEYEKESRDVEDKELMGEEKGKEKAIHGKESDASETEDEHEPSAHEIHEDNRN